MHMLVTGSAASIGSHTVERLLASDAELPGLAEAVLRDGITDQKQIKLMIKNWKADHLRA